MRTAVTWSATVLVLVAGAAVALLTSDGPVGADPAWESVEVARGWSTASGSLTLDDGRPRIALRRPADHDDGGLAYAACDIGCTETEAWAVTELPVEGEVVPHLAVDDWGRPRIASRKDGALRYAACDTDCLDPDRWESTELVEAGDVGGAEGVAFALDGDGRPRVAYADARDRLRYLWCDAGCTRSSGWEDVTVSERGGAASVGDLTFDGIRPWIAYVRSDGGEDQVRFSVCGDDCDDRARWLDASVQRSSTSLRAPSLRLTAEGEPRVAYTWGGRLVYRACDRDCDIQSAWSPPVTVESGPVDSPALVLDAGDRPRVAYSRDGVLRLARCDDTCTTDESWSRHTVEAASDVARPSLVADGEQVHLAVTGATDPEDPRVHYARCAEACGQPAPTAGGQGDPPPTGPTAPTSGPDAEPSPSPSPSPSVSGTATGPRPSSSPSVSSAGSDLSPSTGSTDRTEASTLGSPPVPGDRPTRRGPVGVEETPTPSHDPGSASPAPQPSAISPASRSTDRGGSAWIVVVGGLAAAAVIGARRMDH